MIPRNHGFTLRWVVFLATIGLASCAPSGPAGVVFHTDSTPRLLSQWGLFQRQGDQLQLADGVIEYALNSALFSDYAHKLRTIWVPPGEAGTFVPEDTQSVLALPVGTILSKTFYYPLATGDGHTGDLVRVAPIPATAGPLSVAGVRLLETRLLVRRDTGWVALPYVWNEQQTEAELNMVGAAFDLDLVANGHPAAGEFRYFVPDVNQCAGCHASNHSTRSLQPIGPKPRHLSRPAPHTGFVRAAHSAPAIDSSSQLKQWQELGLLQNDPALGEIPALADWTDQVKPLDDRARAYLDINCSHCHNPRGPADTSGLLLGPDAKIQDVGLCKPPIAAGRGTGNRRVGIAPGDPEASILLHRLRSTDPGVAMPELGRSLSHAEGVDLLTQWIASLDGNCETVGRGLRRQNQPPNSDA